MGVYIYFEYQNISDDDAVWSIETYALHWCIAEGLLGKRINVSSSDDFTFLLEGVVLEL